MDSGPWYESTGPTVKEVKESFKTYLRNKTIRGKKFCFRKIISDAIKDEIPRNRHADEYPFGSYRGYHTFVKPNLLKRILKKIEEKEKERAQKIINRYIMNYFIWPIYLKRFYAPPNGKGYLLLTNKYKK
tara:strand:+ start:209 stop:598 length:390 start_codon:yes stop_codon:yes gene_type:complete